MNPHHDPVDRILTGLRDATPPAGMEQRILNTLEAEANSSTVSFRANRGTPAFRDARAKISLRWAAIAAVATVAVFTGMRMRHHETSSNVSVFTETTPRTAAATRIEVPTPLLPAVARSTPSRNTQSQGAEMGEVHPQLIQVSQAEDAATQISHPAPPVPVTAQEQLLLRYAQHARTEDLAQISTERKTAKEDKEAAEFQAFFKIPERIGESE